MTAMLLTDATGWAGAACLLVAYAGLSNRRLAVGVWYHLLNLAGAGGLAVNGAFHHAWPSTALNLVWLAIGLTALHRTERAKARTSTTRCPTARAAGVGPPRHGTAATATYPTTSSNREPGPPAAASNARRPEPA